MASPKPGNDAAVRKYAVTLAVVLVAIAGIAGRGLSAKAASGASTGTPSTAAAAVIASAPAYGPIPVSLTAFYRAPEQLTGEAPGTVLKSSQFAAAQLHGTAYRLMYVSRSAQNAPVAVTGVVVVPKGTAPATGFPVVSWSHGTNGLGDECAPSLYPASATPPDANALLDRGFEIVATDYAGEGTPGVLPYLAGASAAHNAIDMVRAARRLPAAHASSNYIVWGYSEGGQAALFALDVAATYAPELHLVGDVAGGPPSQLDRVYSELKGGSNAYYLLMMAVGLHAAYGGAAAPLDQLLTPAGMALVPRLEQACLGWMSLSSLAHVSGAATLKADPFTLPAWRKLLMLNDPEDFAEPSATPLLIVQGDADTLIVPTATKSLVAHECALGQTVESWNYAALDHAGALIASDDDVVHWIGDHFAGSLPADTFAPTAARGVTQEFCGA